MAAPSPFAQHGLEHTVAVPDWFLGVYFGVVALICFYELAVFSGLRQRAQRYFVGFLISVSGLLAVVDGLGLRLAWPGRYALDMAAYCVLFSLSLVFVNLFIRHALEIRRLSPALDRFFTAMIILIIVALAVNLLLIGSPPLSNIYNSFMPLLSLINPAGLLVALALLARQRKKTVLWYGIGLLLITLGAWIQYLRAKEGWGPAWFEGGIHAGVLAFILCSMLALRGELSDRERERRALLDEVKRADKLASLGIMTSTIVHDLAAPSAAIANDATVLERGMPPLRQEIEDALPADGRADGGKISESLDRMGSAAAGVASAARRIAGLLATWRGYYRPVPAAAPEILDLGELAEASCRLLESEARSRRVILSMGRRRSPIPVRGAPSRIGQAIVNLILNALQAAAGRPDARVRVEAERGKGKASFLVADNGVGMDSEGLEKAGSLFYSTKGAEGSGLGLYIVKQIADELGGDLNLAAGEAGGLRATLSLPLAEEEARG